ncbi:unnamed protein product [Orchesella dallaii]|uniref:Uncharacterized protein n=1 Tax=Orchesella dallaii TaxID=48710 RepID=A0ABP1REX6_9HEXA
MCEVRERVHRCKPSKTASNHKPDILSPGPLPQILPENPNYLEALLDVEYKVGLSPFRIEKDGFVVSSLGHKLVNILWIGLATLCTIHNGSLICATVKKRGVLLNDREYYSEMGFALFTGIMRIVYIHNLWRNKDIFNKLLKLLHSERFADLFHDQNAFKLVTLIRGLSFASSYVICGLGLNVVPTHVIKTKGWDWKTVLLSHEYGFNLTMNRVNKIFTPSIRIQPEMPWPGTWSPLTMPLGILGMLMDYSSLVLNSCMQDMMMLSALGLLKAINEFKVKMDIPDMQVVLDRYMDVSELSKQVNETIRGSVPATTIVGIIASAYGLHVVWQGDWAPAVVYVVFAVKLFFTFFIAVKISRKCKRFESWLRYRITRDQQNGTSSVKKTS